MNIKQTILKILLVVVWLAVGSGMVVLLVAANKKQQEQVCRKVNIRINDGARFVISKSDILEQLQKTAKSTLVNKPVTKINLFKLEAVLEKHPWVRSAELYFDSKDVLQVVLQERTPVARLFTTANNSFYIDSSGTRMPLMKNLNLRLPVVTNFTNAKKPNHQDSMLLHDVKKLTSFILSDTFWEAQIAQIDITPYQQFELIPTIGNHVIRIGAADDLESKFQKLFVFYKEVMSKTGFHKYRVLDVQFDGQLVAMHNVPLSKIDSIQLQKNIAALIAEARQQISDSISVAVKEEEKQMKMNYSSVKGRPSTTTNNIKVVKKNPNTVKTILKEKKPVKKVEEEEVPEVEKPENDY
jgi:cell division protein FtsQ